MNKVIAFVLFCILLSSCGSTTSNKEKFNYGKSALSTLKEVYKLDLDFSQNVSAPYYYVRQHKDELFKTLEVVEEVEVEKDVFLVFYRYSIGTNIVKKTVYFRKLDGLYLPYYKYYSSYNDDPFKNGKGEEGKALLKKAEEWSSNDNIWWAL